MVGSILTTNGLDIYVLLLRAFCMYKYMNLYLMFINRMLRSLSLCVLNMYVYEYVSDTASSAAAGDEQAANNTWYLCLVRFARVLNMYLKFS